MEYADAVKRVKAEKPKENYVLIEFGYDCKILVPHKDGLDILAGLVNAEKYSDHYQKPTRITEFSKDLIKTTFMSSSEYQRHKIAAMLNITADEVKEMMEAEFQPTPA